MRARILAWLRAHWELVIPLIAGACIGWAAHGDRVKTVTEYKDRVVVQEHTVTVEKPVIEYRDRERVRTVYRDGPVKETIVYKDRSSKETGGSTTTEDTNVESTQQATQTTTPEGRWSVRALGSIDTRGSVAVGAGVDYRVVGPLVVGAWATFPVAGTPGPATVGVAAGLRF